jgi:protein-S-isoprenylcysteine O-methyltransferase Ste14
MPFKQIPPRYLNISIVLAVALHLIIPIKQLIRPPYTYLGIPLILLGLVLNVWSVGLLRKRKTTIEFNQAPIRLVTEGPFRISRNPIYLGGLILSLGMALFLGSLSTFVFPILLFIILDRYYIPKEENILEKTFGNAYRTYKLCVRRWV